MPSSALRAALLLVLVLGSPARADLRPPKVPAALTVTVDYQRVGHDLLALQAQRGFFECGDLIPRFRAIKLEVAVATPSSRVAAAAMLAEIATKIERLRGIQVAPACLDNPLAPGCD